ncbi:MAG: hypothetical protein Ta2A_04720 [Treponemataceae bacterium]|nr:MAG: hypothetical protein Ta2A_04720 [Treponemataceae bacterium]
MNLSAKRGLFRLFFLSCSALLTFAFLFLFLRPGFAQSQESHAQDGILFAFDPSKLEGIEIPRCQGTYSHGDSTERLRDHKMHWATGFAFCYRPSYGESEWVAYTLNAKKLTVAVNRQGSFKADPSVPGGTATTQDYTNSGYDRGHLAPAADMRYSEDAMRESFFMSNIAPQLPHFNRVSWAALEAAVRELAGTSETVWIVTGPVLNKTDFKRIGKTVQIAVPEYFYKVILADKGRDAASGKNRFTTRAYLMPNIAGVLSFDNYACSIDEVEKMTDMDFFSRLPDELENALEATVMPK